MTNQLPTIPTTESTPAPNKQPTPPSPVPDVGPHTGVYAIWQTYCDFIYHYCFKYPKDWTVLADTTAAASGESGEVLLVNHAKTVQVMYVNAYTKDGAIMNFMPTSIDRLAVADQDLAIIGGYIPTSGNNGIAGNNVPEYQVVDRSVLNAYPLTIGAESQFPNTPRFTDQETGDFYLQWRFCRQTRSDHQLARRDAHLVLAARRQD